MHGSRILRAVPSVRHVAASDRVAQRALDTQRILARLQGFWRQAATRFGAKRSPPPSSQRSKPQTASSASGLLCSSNGLLGNAMTGNLLGEGVALSTAPAAASLMTASPASGLAMFWMSATPIGVLSTVLLVPSPQ